MNGIKRGIEFSQQVYWHELPNPKCPPGCLPNSLEVLKQYVEKIKNNPSTSPHKLIKKIKRERETLKKDASDKFDDFPLHHYCISSAKFTQFYALNELLKCMEVPVCTLHELAYLVLQAVHRNTEETNKEPASIIPIILEVLESRGLTATRIPEVELKLRSNKIHNHMLKKGQNAIILLDFNRPIFCCILPYTKNYKGAVTQNRVICPIEDPVPFCLKTRVVCNVSYKQCLVLLVSHEGNPASNKLLPLNSLDGKESLLNKKLNMDNLANKLQFYEREINNNFINEFKNITATENIFTIIPAEDNYIHKKKEWYHRFFADRQHRNKFTQMIHKELTQQTFKTNSTQKDLFY